MSNPELTPEVVPVSTAKSGFGLRWKNTNRGAHVTADVRERAARTRGGLETIATDHPETGEVVAQMPDDELASEYENFWTAPIDPSAGGRRFTPEHNAVSKELSRRMEEAATGMSDDEILSPETRRFVVARQNSYQAASGKWASVVKGERERRIMERDPHQLFREDVQMFAGEMLGVDYEQAPDTVDGFIQLAESNKEAEKRLYEALWTQASEGGYSPRWHSPGDIAADFTSEAFRSEFASEEETDRMSDFLAQYVPDPDPY